MNLRGLHLEMKRQRGRTTANLQVSVSFPGPPQLKTEPISQVGPSPIPGSKPQGYTWGEKWRYEDPLHALGAIPFAGIPYRLAVVGGSYLLDLFTAEQQGITPISFPEGDRPGWLNSNLVL